MEHRWGARTRLDMPAQVQCGTQSLVLGILRDASVSGAFFCTAAPMPLLACVHVHFGMQSTGVEAYVVRREADGFGLEWAELAPPLVVQLLSTAPASSLPAHVVAEPVLDSPALQDSPIEPPHSDLGVALAADSPSCKVLLEELKVLLAQLD
jgi:hypothetical protein